MLHEVLIPLLSKDHREEKCDIRSVVDPGEGSGWPALFLDQTEAQRTDKTFFLRLGPSPYLRVWMTAPPPPFRSGSATAGYHGSNVSGTQQSFLTETAICTVKRWKKFTGYRLVPECNHAHTCHFFFSPYQGLLRSNVVMWYNDVSTIVDLLSLIFSVEPHPGDMQSVMGSRRT